MRIHEIEYRPRSDSINEGLLDAIKQKLGNNIDVQVARVTTAAQALQVIYKIATNEKYMETVVHLLRKAITMKLKMLNQRFSENPIIDKFTALMYKIKPRNNTFVDFLKSTIIICMINGIGIAAGAITSTINGFVTNAALQKVKGSINELIDGALPDSVKTYVTMIASKVMTLDSVIAALPGANAIFTLLKTLGIANEILFAQLTEINKKLSAFTIVGEGKEETHQGSEARVI